MSKKVLFIVALIISNLYAQNVLKIGVLNYGTVNWELDVIKHYELDKKYGFDLQLTQLASKNAQLIALQSKSVDMIVNDWIWVNTQRDKNKQFVFYPYSKATGTLYINPKSEIKTFENLKDKELGIAGGVDDKTWIILRAYAKKKYNLDLKNIVKPVFATAPILYKKMEDESLNASINYWHFNAKLEKFGMKPLVLMENVFSEFGVNSDIPFVGWTFYKDFSIENHDLINSFLKASFEAKDILNSSEKEWDRLKDIMKVDNENDFEALKEGYKKSIIKDFTNENIKDIEKIFSLLLNEGKDDLSQESRVLEKDIFYKVQ